MTTRSVLVATLTVAAVAAGLSLQWRAWQYGQRHGSDLAIFVTTTLALQAGDLAAAYPLVKGNTNPPHFHLWIVPAFPVATFVAVSLIGLTVTAARLWRFVAPAWRPLALVVAVWSLPTTEVILAGQVTWILLPFLMMAWLRWRADRWIEGACWFAVPLACKLFLGLVVLWLWTRSRVAAVVCLAAMVACYAVGIAVYGPESYVAWVRGLQGVHGWMFNSWNTSLWYVSQVLTGGPWLGVIGSVVVLAVLAAVSGESVDRVWPLLIVSCLLLSPLGWNYYLWWLIPGLVALPWRWPWAAALLVQPFVTVTALDQALFVVVVWGSIVWALWSARRRTSDQQPTRGRVLEVAA